MSNEEFFKKHGISNKDELEKLPFVFRDASTHYYHKNTDKVYSYNYLHDYWYISSYSEKLRLQHVNPKEYQDKQNRADIERKQEEEAYEKFCSQYSTIEDIIEKHKENDRVIITQNFLGDIIDNKLNEVTIMKNMGFFLKRYTEFHKLSVYNDETTIYTYPEDNLRESVIVWDFQSPDNRDIFVRMNDYVTKLDLKTVLVVGNGITGYTDIEFIDEDGKQITGIQYKKLFAYQTKKVLNNYTLVIPNGEYSDFIVCAGIICPSN